MSNDINTRGRLRRYAGVAGLAAVGVGLVGGAALASSTAGSDIVPIAPHILTSGSSVAAGKSLIFIVSGGSTTVPTAATRVQFSVTVSSQVAVGEFTAQPYLDAADASGDSVTWPAAKTTVTGTLLEPVGVSNKVAFINSSAGSVRVAIKITGYSTAVGLENRLDALESSQRSDDAAVSAMRSSVAALNSQLYSAQQVIAAQGSTINSQSAAISSQSRAISSLSVTVASDDAVIQALPRLLVGASPTNLGTFSIGIVGANLQPGSTVTLHVTDSSGTTTTIVQATVKPDGRFSGQASASCSATSIYVTGTNIAGDTVASNNIAKDGCPTQTP